MDDEIDDVPMNYYQRRDLEKLNLPGVDLDHLTQYEAAGTSAPQPTRSVA